MAEKYIMTGTKGNMKKKKVTVEDEPMEKEEKTELTMGEKVSQTVGNARARTKQALQEFKNSANRKMDRAGESVQDYVRSWDKDKVEAMGGRISRALGKIKKRVSLDFD